MAKRYTERIVAFLDILGFGRLVESVDGPRPAAAIIADIEAVLAKKVAGPWKDTKGFRIKMFSDCICASAPPTLGDFMFTIAKVADMQKALLGHGLLLRGAISSGRHYESRSVIFSQALIRAYRLESAVAVYPRVIVDPPLLPRFMESPPLGPVLTPFLKEFMTNIMLLRDSDNQIFVNYHNLLSTRKQNTRRKRNLELERDLIERGRREHHADASIMAKLAWLARYHNFVCQKMADSHPNLTVGAVEDHGFEMIVPRSKGTTRGSTVRATARP